MKFQYKLYSFLMLLASVFTSCSETSTPEPDKQAMLVNKNWILTASTATLSTGSGTSDNYALLPATAKDNILTFTTETFSPTNPAMVMQITEGASRITGAPDQVAYGYWAFGTPNSITATSSLTGPRGWGVNNKDFLRLTPTRLAGTNLTGAAIITTVYDIYMLDAKTLQMGYTMGTRYIVDTYTAQ